MPEVHIQGQIKGARGFDNRDVFAKWKIVAGSDKWRILDGDAAGRTWLAEQKDEDEMATWNEPLDVSFVCSELQGWPKMMLQVFQTDEFGQVLFGGYGFCFVPTSPGVHLVEMAVFRPRGTLLEAFAASFLGTNQCYENPDVVMSGESRFGHHTISAGVIDLEFEIAIKGFGDHIQFEPDLTDDEKNSSLCHECAPSKNQDRLEFHKETAVLSTSSMQKDNANGMSGFGRPSRFSGEN